MVEARSPALGGAGETSEIGRGPTGRQWRVSWGPELRVLVNGMPRWEPGKEVSSLAHALQGTRPLPAGRQGMDILMLQMRTTKTKRHQGL